MNPLALFLEPPGPLLTHLHTVYMAYSECLPTRLNPLAERACFSQADIAVKTLTVRAHPGRLRALSVLRSHSVFAWRVCMGTQGA